MQTTRKNHISRLSCVHVQTFGRSAHLCAFALRLSCVHQNLLRSCSDFNAFIRISCVYIQTFVRSSDFRAFTRISCLQQNSCVQVKTFVRSCPDFSSFIWFLSVHLNSVPTHDFAPSFPDFHASNARRNRFRTSLILLFILYSSEFSHSSQILLFILYSSEFSHSSLKAATWLGFLE